MFCHVNLVSFFFTKKFNFVLKDVCGSEEKKFTVRQPGKPMLQFTMQVGDEAIVAPLSFFTPELFGATDSSGIITQNRSQGDSEDPHDEIFLRETTVNNYFLLYIYVYFFKKRENEKKKKLLELKNSWKLTKMILLLIR